MKIKNKPNIIFLAMLPWERACKLAVALRSKGISVLLVYQLEPPHFDPREYFEYTFKAQDALEAVSIVHRLRPDIIHLFNFGADEISYYLFQNKIGKIVYDYKDCVENVISPPNPDVFRAIQRQCVEYADGLCCRDMQLWNYCRVNGIRPRGKKILFIDYCWGENKRNVSVREDGEVHTVIAGGITIEKAQPANIDDGYLYITYALVNSGIHVHIYAHKPQNQLSDYFELAEKSPYCHMHEVVPMSKYVQELSQYDYGLAILQGSLFHDIGLQTYLHGHEKYVAAAKWYDCLEAGLDILISPELRFGYHVMRNVNVAVPATPELFLQGNAKKVLSDWRGRDTNLRINAARERYDIRNNIDRLIAFYRSL